MGTAGKVGKREAGKLGSSRGDTRGWGQGGREGMGWQEEKEKPNGTK